MTHELPNQFTVRVYGLLIHEDRILLSKENIKGDIYTKFPGGGLEFGEGIIECLKREFMEEVGIHLQQTEHFYTSEGYFPSAFHTPPKQVISIYYKVWTEQLDKIRTGNPAHEHLLTSDEDQILYWADLKNLLREPIELPIDKIVMAKLSGSI